MYIFKVRIGIRTVHEFNGFCRICSLVRAIKGELSGHHTDHADNIPAVRWYYLLFPIVPCIILLVSLSVSLILFQCIQEFVYEYNMCATKTLPTKDLIPESSQII